MTQTLLDTNTVSHLVRGHPAVALRVVAAPMASLCISAITEGELLYGLARRPDATRLHAVVQQFLLRVDVLPWDRAAARRYGSLRALMERKDQTLPPLDMQIAAHAQSTGAVLVTSDRAFKQVAGLLLEDWTK